MRERTLISKTAGAIKRAREAGILVGFVRVGFSAGYPECPPNSQVFSAAPQHGLFKLGGWGTEIHPDLEQREGDIQVVKHRVSPFYSTTLEVILLEDLCAAHSIEEHRNSVQSIARFCKTETSGTVVFAQP